MSWLHSEALGHLVSTSRVCHQRLAYRNSMDSGRLVNFLDFSDRSGSGAAANRTISTGTTRARMRQVSYWQNMFAKKFLHIKQRVPTTVPPEVDGGEAGSVTQILENHQKKTRKSMKNHEISWKIMTWCLPAHGRIRSRFQSPDTLRMPKLTGGYCRMNRALYFG